MNLETMLDGPRKPLLTKTVPVVCVLLVIDDAERSTQLRELLAADPESDFRLTTVERVDEALTLALQRAFDVLLIDVRCPNLDAPLSVANLRLAAAHQSLVVLAADGYEKLTKRLLEAGALYAIAVTLPDTRSIGHDIRRVLARASATNGGGAAGSSQKTVRFAANGGSDQSRYLCGHTGGGGGSTDAVVRGRADIHGHGDVYAPAAREFIDTIDGLNQSQTLEAIERLACGVAHDFDNVLTTINQRLASLNDALVPGDPRRDDVNLLRRATEQGVDLTRKLLEYTRPANGAAMTQTAPVGSKPTILLAEDENAIRKLARRILERAGYDVVEAVNADEALEIASVHAEPFALLLTDLMLPGMNGNSLAAALQARQPDLPVICMSGYTEDVIPHTGATSVEFRFLEKPFTPASLLAAVSAVLPRPAAHAPSAA